jgi:hypothetical protein
MTWSVLLWGTNETWHLILNIYLSSSKFRYVQLENYTATGRLLNYLLAGGRRHRHLRYTFPLVFLGKRVHILSFELYEHILNLGSSIPPQVQFGILLLLVLLLLPVPLLLYCLNVFFKIEERNNIIYCSNNLFLCILLKLSFSSTAETRKLCNCDQWRAVHGSKGSIASVVKKRKEFIHK